VDDAFAADSDEVHVPFGARFEPYSGPGRDIEPHPVGGLAVEGKSRVRFEEVIMGADLDRPVAGVFDGHSHGFSVGVDLDRLVGGE